MENITSQTFVEYHFADLAKAELPTTDLEIGRNDWDILFYRWLSPSTELEALTVYVREYEIVLSTKISHMHVEEHDLPTEYREGEDMQRCMAQQGVAIAAAIMAGELAFTQTYDGQGNKFCSGVSPTAKLAEGLRYTREVFGDEMTERAFIWTGEVPIQE